MSTASTFTCLCGKTQGWITEGEDTKEPCPVCGRRYTGVYDRENLTIKAVPLPRPNDYNYETSEPQTSLLLDKNAPPTKE